MITDICEKNPTDRTSTSLYKVTLVKVLSISEVEWSVIRVGFVIAGENPPEVTVCRKSDDRLLRRSIL